MQLSYDEIQTLDLRKHESHPATQQASRSEPCASPRRCLRRSDHILKSFVSVSCPTKSPVDNPRENSPPWKSVSPVNTTLSSPSCMNQHTLSCVWQGVWRALTAMLPMLKLSPWAGVLFTFSQSLPPMISRLGRPRAVRFGHVSEH